MATARKPAWRRLVQLLQSRSAVARETAASQLGSELANALSEDTEATYDPGLISWAFAEICTICVSNAWESRMAAAATLEVALSPLLNDMQESKKMIDRVKARINLLSFERVDLDLIFKHAKPLLSRAIKRRRGAPTQIDKDLQRERAEVLRNLRLAAYDPGNTVPDDEDLVDDDDLDAESDEERDEALTTNPGVADLLSITASSQTSSQSVSSTSARSSKNDARARGLKRSAREIAQARVQIAARSSGNATDMEDDLKKLVAESSFKGKTAASQAAGVWIVLAQHLLSDRWEARHGSATALGAFLSPHSEWHPTCLEDLAVRCLSVLGMDRFGDYAADSVVAPVRESCARLLAIATANAHGSPCALQVIDALCFMFAQTTLGKDLQIGATDAVRNMGASTLWGRRYAGLLAAKFLLLSSEALRDALSTKCLSTIGQILFKESQENIDTEEGTLSDSAAYNDEIRRAAADVALICIWGPETDLESANFNTDLAAQVFSSMSESKEAACIALWDLLGKLDDVGLATSESVALLATSAILASPDVADQTSISEVMDTMMGHPTTQVQHIGLRMLCLMACNAGALLTSANHARVYSWFKKTMHATLQRDVNFELARRVWAELVSRHLGLLSTSELNEIILTCLDSQHASGGGATALSYLFDQENCIVGDLLAAQLPHLQNQESFMTVLRVAATTMIFHLEKLERACEQCLTRDWALQSIDSVVTARNTLEASCAFLMNCYRDAGLNEEEITNSFPVFEASFANIKVVDLAHDFVENTVQKWVTQLPEPESREDARRWNETTAGARDHALGCIQGLSAALASAQVRQEALFQVAKVRALSSDDPFVGEVGPFLKPLIPALLHETQGVEHETLAHGLATLLGKIVDESKTKARTKASKKLLTATWPRAESFLRYLVTLYPDTDMLWNLLPEMDERLRASEPCAIWACATFAKEITMPKALQYLRNSLLNLVTTESGILDPITGLICALNSWDDLAAATWDCIHQVILPIIEDTSQTEDARASGLTLIANLVNDRVDPSLRFLPFSAGLVPIIMPLLHDASSEKVRDLSARILAMLIQVAPIERNAHMPESITYIHEVNQCKSLRRKGHEFLDTLLAGASSEHDALGVLGYARNAGIELRSYQREGVCWLAFLAKHGLSGALCDDLGLGKTLMALTLMTSLADRKTPECSIVVCPSSLTGHWCEEIHRWYHDSLRAFAYVGDPRDRGMELVRLLQFMADPGNASTHAVMVVSYNVLTRDVDRIVRTGLQWRLMVIDEAHSIRNPYTSAAEKCKQIGASAVHRLAITGTPVHNDVLDLWSVFDFLMPGYLGDVSSFEQNVAKPVRASRAILAKDSVSLQAAEDEEGDGISSGTSAPVTSSKMTKREQQRELESIRAAEALEGLRRKILPFLLRRTKEAVLQDLPPKIVQDLITDMAPVQARLYAALKGDVRAAEKDALGHTARLLMACTHPLLSLRSMKRHTKDRLQRRLLEAKLSSAQEDGYRASGKFRALVDLLRNVVLPSVSTATGVGDARLSSMVSDEDSSSSALDSKGQDATTNADLPAKALVFTQWTGTLDLIEEQVLQGALHGALGFLRLDGSIAAHDRQAIVNRFNTEPGIQVLLATTKVGGQGLNLTGANVVIFVEHDWNPMNDLQAMDRAHRLGQLRAVNVYRLLSRYTVEERVLGLQRFKQHVADRVVDSANSNVDSMRTDEILQALDLPDSMADSLDKVHEEIDPHDTEYKDFDVAAFVQKLDGGIM